eukprot:CAMPEP_0185547200 /NCGR_PEP_ID=MMETSP1381-20130426/5970_1 /TAXON_ID=298111 /ORGANISM="Pavlova sp., Strain CCMP459" /LENGTH=142 /DNA_ID=CAMNT_0028159725 /DNA_START=66 /DNA_END=491 /DNA_ORIENTATION=+
MPLGLPVLRGRAPQSVVQLHRLVRRYRRLVLGRVLAQPEVKVPCERARARAPRSRVQDDVRVALVEGAVVRPLHRYHLHLLDAPHLHARLLAHRGPKVLARLQVGIQARLANPGLGAHGLHVNGEAFGAAVHRTAAEARRKG